MNPYQAYRTSKQTSWTRVGMLITLYREAETAVMDNVRLLKEENSAEFVLSQIRSMKLLIAILDGIRPEFDAVSRNIYQLVVFTFQQVSLEKLENQQNARRVLTSLKESFEAIESTANQLEADGAIPKLEHDLNGTLSIG